VGMSRSVRSTGPAAAPWPEARKAPRTLSAMEWRMENMVLAAPTSIMPTAIGRTMLNQMV